MGGGALSPLFSFLLSAVAVLSLCALCSPSPFFLSLYFFLLCFVLLWLFSSSVSVVPLHVRDILFIVETRIFVFIISLSLSCSHQGHFCWRHVTFLCGFLMFSSYVSIIF